MKTTKDASSRFVVALCLALVPAAWAHHSQSEYDSRKKVEVEGTVSKVEWKSPHAWIYVDVTNDKGEKVNWHFELPSPNTLMRRGWTRDSLKIGDRIKVTGSPARNDPDIRRIVNSSSAPNPAPTQVSASDSGIWCPWS